MSCPHTFTVAAPLLATESGPTVEPFYCAACGAILDAEGKPIGEPVKTLGKLNVEARDARQKRERYEHGEEEGEGVGPVSGAGSPGGAEPSSRGPRLPKLRRPV